MTPPENIISRVGQFQLPWIVGVFKPPSIHAFHSLLFLETAANELSLSLCSLFFPPFIFITS